MTDNMFTWVQTHKEIVHIIRKYRNNQGFLIDILRDMGINGLIDEERKGKRTNLKEIDPFTFFCYIYKYGTKKRLELLQSLAKRLEVSIPMDDSGIPAVNALKVCMFPFKHSRKNKEIDKLWDFFENILHNNVTDTQFESILRIEGIGNAKITEAMFNIMPDKYLPLNAPTKAYIENVLNINTSFKTFQEYKNILSKIHDKSTISFYQLSYDSWKWTMNSDSKKKNNSKLIEDNQSTTKYWLYAPAENASLWEECFRLGIMSLGWDELGNLIQYPDKTSIVKELQRIYSTNSSKKNDATANHEFRNVISIGDVIIVKKGRSELLGYGIVASDYYYDENRTNHKSCRKVDWKLKGVWQTDHSLALKTLTDITKYSTEHPDYEMYYERLLGIMNKEYNPHIEENNKSSFSAYPLNTIFYGPPGTGKTYHSIKRAAEIIENRVIDNYNDALKIFSANLHNQIEFITFHQNYSYEDFVQGLRPDIENDSQLTFNRKDGVFKQISQRALDNLRDAESLEIQKLSFEDAFKELLTPLIEEQEEVEIQMRKVSYYIMDIINNSIQFRKASGGTAHTLSIGTLKRMYEVESVLTIQGLSVYYEAILNRLLNIGKKRISESERVKKKNYVLIIDEINRANISRVFGELITLIEPDKRSQGSVPITAKLPSGDPFLVPSNLYIVGTMNTADKSIALLDIALRRRFEFEPMYPMYELNGNSIRDNDVLKKLNKVITEKKGYDFQIGHSYFMDDSFNLVNTMNRKIIPLLLEYFMNDEKEVKEILQLAGLKIEQGSWPIRIMGRND
jgi:5-methylcytosine-specific restriction protein B